MAHPPPTFPSALRNLIMFVLVLLVIVSMIISAHGLSAPYRSGPAIPAAKAPNPKLQLERFECSTTTTSTSSSGPDPSCGHNVFSTVFGRSRSSRVDAGWKAVGYVRSVFRPGGANDPSLYTSVFGSVQCQRKLIVEYACGIHRSLRDCKISFGYEDLELGVRLLEDGQQTTTTPYYDRIKITSSSIIEAVPPPAKYMEEEYVENNSNDDKPNLENYLSNCGFVGLLPEDGFQNNMYREYYERQAAVGTIVVGTGTDSSSANDSSPVTISSNTARNTDRILSAEYYRSVYDNRDKDTATAIPWDLGGRPQPTVVKAYEQGKLRGRILDAGCGGGDNSFFLAPKFGVTKVVGFDLAPGAIAAAQQRLREESSPQDGNVVPHFFIASCTDVADRHGDELFDDDDDDSWFDVVLDSALLHCLSDDDALLYVRQMTRLVRPDTGRAYVGCFSDQNPDPWDNPRRLSRSHLERLFCSENGWEIVDIRDTWWARPSQRGTDQGSFCMAWWMEARRLSDE